MGIEEKINGAKTVYKGIFLNVERLSVTLPNGEKGERDVIRHPGAVAILAVNKNGDILIEKQYRAALNKVILEIPAGKLDPGEDPMNAAIRELKEETGYSAGSIKKLGDIALAAGYSDEIISIYLAQDLVAGSNNLDIDEFLEIDFYPKKKILEQIKNGEIIDSKTICAMTYLELE
ncbi:MAG: NUDIX hydrolase [Clostridiaceae bacterium]